MTRWPTPCCPGSRSAAALFVLGALGCQPAEPTGGGFYEERIAPILTASCGRTTDGCHLADDRGTAPGNLDLSSYDSLRRRTDALVPYGPYPRPLLLLKVDEPQELSVETHDPPDPSRPELRQTTIFTDIRHGADVTMPRGSRGFAELASWLASGFARTGAPDERVVESVGECVRGAGSAPGFAPDVEPADRALFERFVSEVQPLLATRCAGSGCHGAALADLHLACGEDEAERRWNYFISLQHLTDPAERSELLRRPLAIARGGAFHGGGDTFATADDPGYAALLGWAEEVVASAPHLVREVDASDGYRFFVNRVQPVLVRKGCTTLGCHSPISAVFDLRGGAQGAFSRFARRRNYELARRMLAFDSPDPNQSRIVAKNLFPHDGGIAHRGGSLLEDFGSVSARPEDCAGVDADSGDLNEIPGYCVLVRWHAIEREAAIARGDIDSDPVRALVWVARPPGIGGADDFDTYRPGADLRIADASVDASLAVSVGASRSLLDACGIDAESADVRTPAASFDGDTIAFAVRTSAGTPLRIWTVAPDGSGCAPLDAIAPADDEEDGVLVHDLDPAFAPDGRLVFASTRGLSHGRPTRTPASLAPNADLYVYDPSSGSIRQLTFLLNQELAPGFMQDGRVIYTVEKRELDFHMLALRRQNLDGGDYHPLYASRHSLGFGSATEVEQLPDQNFVFVAAPLGEAAGSIAVFNRSIGPDQDGRDERGYLHSLGLPARSLHHGGRGLFRSPWPLATGRVVASCALDASDPRAPADFDLCELAPRTGEVRRIGGERGVAETEVIAIGRRLSRGVLVSDGAGIDHPLVVPGATDAEVRFNDFPMIQSLMFTNTRTGRPIDHRIGGFEVLVHRPPPAGARTFAELGERVVADSYGSFYSDASSLGWVPLFDDGSARMRLTGGVAISFRMTDEAGEPLEMQEGLPMSGPDVQREHEQYYPGERIQRSISRRFFNAVCGICHGSISGRELDVGVDLDVISGASVNAARDAQPVDLRP